MQNYYGGALLTGPIRSTFHLEKTILPEILGDVVVLGQASLVCFSDRFTVVGAFYPDSMYLRNNHSIRGESRVLL